MPIITLTTNDDVFTATAAGDTINGIDGNDTLTASAGGNRLQGGIGDDSTAASERISCMSRPCRAKTTRST